ncbi:MAG TPA: MBL fold metallo-hydrolase [Solirubrobacteraceae bacterium]|jgi:ribonuclease BN (tRNA processing enzyme)|nr:MBL fold metallo-hydrolase [Solirubrobacteraceae bacterium]
MRVDLCGVRGSIPAPGIDFVRYGGQTSCVALTAPGNTEPTLILDAGTGLQAASKLLAGRAFKGTLLLTHLHWDHTIGLPFFGAGERLDARTRVVIPEQGNGDSAARTLARVMCPPFFPIEPTQMRGDWRFDTIEPGTHEFEGFEVLAREIPHKGGRTYGFRVSDGRSTLTYMPDHCPTALGAGEDGFGEYHDAAIELARDSDLLIHDAQLLPEELPAEAAYGHAAADYAVGLAARAGARSVALFHHRPNRTDTALDALAARLGDHAPVRVAVAAEGTTLEL